jgi:hypothetical protein
LLSPRYSSLTYEKFSADNAALLLIDHQVGTMGWVRA